MLALLGFGMWAIQGRENGRLIGNVGLFTAWRDIDPEFGEQPEMGWIMDPEYHGTGMASEACAAAQWNCPTAEELLESLVECGLEVQPGWKFVPSPVLKSEAALRKIRFGPHLQAIQTVESAGYDPAEIGWGELRFAGSLNQSPSNS